MLMAGLEEQAYALLVTVWAMALGALVGFERQMFAKPAGLRTHMLVAGAAALVTTVTATLAADAAGGDPTRGAHAIMTGIGFLGAGAIMRQGSDNPSGMTTAATIFYTAGVGVAVALGYGLVASAATVLAYGVLQLMALSRPYQQGD